MDVRVRRGGGDSAWDSCSTVDLKNMIVLVETSYFLVFDGLTIGKCETNIHLCVLSKHVAPEDADMGDLVGEIL